MKKAEDASLVALSTKIPHGTLSLACSSAQKLLIMLSKLSQKQVKMSVCSPPLYSLFLDYLSCVLFVDYFSINSENVLNSH